MELKLYPCDYGTGTPTGYHYYDAPPSSRAAVCRRCGHMPAEVDRLTRERDEALAALARVEYERAVLADADRNGNVASQPITCAMTTADLDGLTVRELHEIAEAANLLSKRAWKAWGEAAKARNAEIRRGR